ncbi:Ferric siderophore transport system, periplasmic binding protein TonB [hydrothermal vent metagenome]|uniref:Ferric siderophore transport system, periplasmic binding protein TonB n=1 Tax=hydrothermal vent metagenome TaxID=652676 RepID=A0A1W1C005_9ZZZZ
MNRKSFSFFVALLIHLVIFLFLYILFTQANHQIKPTIKKEKRVKISLKDFKIQKPKKTKRAGQLKQKPKPTPIAPPMPKGGQLKKIVQKPLPKYNPKKKKRIPHLNKPKSKPKTKKKESQPPKKIQKLPPSKTKPLIPVEKRHKEQNLTKKETPKNNNPLYALLSEDHSKEEIEQKKKSISSSNGVMQDIKELYGDEFGKLSAGQQKYILDNQEIMRRITQQVLNRVARVNIPRDLSVNTYNIIEFKLHPDGSMSDFRFIKKSGVYILDETTKETIEYAYSKYPHPSETTLIRYNVFYNLARY